MKFILSSVLFFTSAALCQAQVDTAMQDKKVDEVVVTATRTEKRVKDIAVPMSVIDGKQIQLSGLTRLNEILSEQTGLTLVQNQAGVTGIQVQGFDPAYTMILIDGEPLLGRTAGTIELSRISLRNVKKIEILKGGGSCLYGSEAMSGVLNIITYPPSEQLQLSAFSRFGSNTTTDIGGDASSKTGKVSWYIFGNRYSTEGYDLRKDKPGVTVSPYSNYTTNGRLYFPIAQWDTRLSGRYFFERQKPSLLVGDTTYEQSMSIADANFTATSSRVTENGYTLKFNYYGSQYQAISHMTNQETAHDEGTSFRQRFHRLEHTAEKAFGPTHLVNAGIGFVHEELQSGRYSGHPAFNSAYFFTQHDWKVNPRLNLVSGARFDHHGAFGNQLSPKLSVLYKAKSWLRLKASLGSGFKAPDFRQLYLDFNNPAVGYNVFGSRNVVEGVHNLEAQGVVTDTLPALAQVKSLKAEISRSINIGFTVDLGKNHEFSVNAFNNWVHNLIEAVPVAQKSNNQFIYSYINLNRIITRGIELNSKSTVSKNLTLNLGYQYLEAFDPTILRRIDQGEFALRDPNSSLQVTMKRSYYKGLQNRSPHTANARLSYNWSKPKIEASLRWICRSKYAFSDANGNLIMDITDTFVQGYSTFNASIIKQIQSFSLQLTFENITNYRETTYLPSLPGRLVHLGLNWKL